MDAEIVGELRVEGGSEQPPLSDQDGRSVDTGEHLDLASRISKPRSPDEDAAEALETRGGTWIHDSGEGIHLGAVGVAN